MTAIPEPMRREQIIAMGIARSQGRDYGGMSSEDRRRLHVIARAAMPGVTQLLEELHTLYYSDGVRTHRTAMSKGYIDGFTDGLIGMYRNHCQDREKWGEEERRLKSTKSTKWPLAG